MESMMNVPDDMFKQELLPYLTARDIVNLDSSCMDNKYRPQLMEKIKGVILTGTLMKPLSWLEFNWLQ